MEKTGLELIEFQVENEIHRLGEKSVIIILYQKSDGQYLEHIINENDKSVMLYRQEFLPLMHDIDISISTLGKFSKEIKKLLLLERKLNSMKKY